MPRLGDAMHRNYVIVSINGLFCTVSQTLLLLHTLLSINAESYIHPTVNELKRTF